MKGDIEFQYDLPAAEKTWTEVRALASQLGSAAWESRAGGELGCIAFLNGEVFTALRMVATAYLEAEMRGDVAAQIKRLTALGEGLAEFGRPADAIRFFDKALDAVIPESRCVLSVYRLPGKGPPFARHATGG